MNEKIHVDFNYGSTMNDFMNGVKKTLVQQDDFAGIGGHEPQNQNGHGEHSQTSIGMKDNITINFRELLKP